MEAWGGSLISPLEITISWTTVLQNRSSCWSHKQFWEIYPWKHLRKGESEQTTPSPPIKADLTRTSGAHQTVQHCMWPLWQHWDFRGSEPYHPLHSSMEVWAWDRDNLLTGEISTPPGNTGHFLLFSRDLGGLISEGNLCSLQEPHTRKQKKKLLLINVLKRYSLNIIFFKNSLLPLMPRQRDNLSNTMNKAA